MHAWRGGLAALWFGAIAAGCSAAGGGDPESGGTAGTRPDGGKASPQDALPGPSVLARGEPLAEPLSFAFIAGYHGSEQIHLVGAHGAVTRVSSWDRSAAYTDECPGTWSTGGYPQGSGRFSGLHFTHDGSALLFGERTACPTSGYRGRVLHHDLASGVTTSLAASEAPPAFVSAAGLTIAIARRDLDEDPDDPVEPAQVSVYEVDAGSARRIEMQAGAKRLQLPRPGGALLARWHRTVLLLVDGLIAHERRDGEDSAFQASALFDPLSSTEVAWLRESPSGTRLCAIAGVAETFYAGDARGWVLTPEGRWLATPAHENRYLACEFSPDEGRVLFGRDVFEVRDDELVQIATDAVPHGTVAWRGALYGHDDPGFARIAWSTLAHETMLPASALPALCGSRPAGDLRSRVSLRVPPDARALAFGKISCGCIDCDLSGTFAWHADSGLVATVEEVWGEHDVYGIAWLPDGGAVVASTQSKSTGAPGEQELRPSAASYLRVHADGAVETVGPLRGVNGAIHSVASFPASPSSPGWYF